MSARKQRPRAAALVVGALLACASSACDPGRVPVPSVPARSPEPSARDAWQRSLVAELDCPGMASATNLCVVTDVIGQVLLLDLDAAADQRGSTCVTHAYASRGAFAWLGGQLFACDRETRELVAVDLVDGALRVASLVDDPFCGAVTRWGTRLVVIGAKVQIFEDFSGIERGTPSRVIERSLGAGHAVVVGDVLYTIGAAADALDRLSLTTGEALPPLRLEVEGPVNSLGATAAGELVLIRPPWVQEGAALLDAQTGAALRRLRLDAYVESASFGLACDGVWVPGPAPRPVPTNPVRFGGLCRGDSVTGFDAGDAPAGVEAELHVVGIQSASTGTVTVEIDRPGPVHLVLVGYDPVHWSVQAARRTELRSVLVSGYGRATLSAPTAASTELRVYEQGGVPVGYGHRWESYEARRTRYALESSLDLPMRSFSGCYDGERFELR